MRWIIHDIDTSRSTQIPPFNPFTDPACKISGLKKCTHTPSNSRFYGALAALFSILCVLMKTLSNAKAKKKQKGLRISNFALLLVVLEWHHGNEGVNYKITPAYSLFNGTAFRTCLQIAQSPEADTVTWCFRKAMMIKTWCWRNTQNALIGAVIALVIKRPAEKNEWRRTIGWLTRGHDVWIKTFHQRKSLFFIL